MRKGSWGMPQVSSNAAAWTEGPNGNAENVRRKAAARPKVIEPRRVLIVSAAPGS